jgi:hypothetical protein
LKSLLGRSFHVVADDREIPVYRRLQPGIKERSFSYYYVKKFAPAGQISLRSQEPASCDLILNGQWTSEPKCESAFFFRAGSDSDKLGKHHNSTMNQALSVTLSSK